jgi:large subunit ribosomal protein L25
VKGIILDAELRTAGSKKSLASLRKSGKIPAVFYGKNIEAESIAVSSKAFISIVETSGANAVVYLNFKDGKKPAIIKSLQRDVLSQNPIHVDFQAVSLKDKVEVFVPLHIEGVADGVKNFGGVMEFIVREVEVEALPEDIPQKISVDVGALGIGDRITIADLPKMEGVKYLQDISTLIVHVVAVTLTKEEKSSAGAEGEEATQPEVISKGKKDKENEESAVTTGTSSSSGTKK